MRILFNHEHSSACQISARALLWRTAADSITPRFEGALETEGKLCIGWLNLELPITNCIQDHEHSGEEVHNQIVQYELLIFRKHIQSLKESVH